MQKQFFSVATFFTFMAVIFISVSIVAQEAEVESSTEGVQKDSQKDSQVEEFEIPVGWKLNEERTFRILKHIETPSRTAAGEIKETETVQMAKVKVIKETSDAIVLAWTLGETKNLSDPAADKNKVAKKLNNIFAGLTVELEVGKDGYFRELKNWKTVKKSVDELVVVIRNTLIEAGVSPKDIDEIIENAMKVAGTKEACEQKLSEPVQLMLAPLGSVYSDEPYEFQEQVPGPKRGTVIPLISKYTLKSYDKQEKRAVVTYEQEINRNYRLPADKKKVAGEPEIVIPKNVEMLLNTEFSLSTETGWPTRIHSVRMLKRNGQGVRNSMTLELVLSN